MNVIYILIDNTFKFVLTFLFNFIWCTYFFKSQTTRWLISIVISIFLSLVFYAVSKRKDKKNKISSKEKQHIIDVLNTFIYMQSNKLIDFFYRLVQTKHKVIKYNKHLIIENDDGNVVLYPCIKNEKLTLADFAEIIKDVSNKEFKRLVILCLDFDNKLNIEKNKFKFDILFVKNGEIYFKLLKKYEFYPEITIKSQKKSKNTLKFLLASAVNKKRTKSYLLSALCLLFASFFNPYRFYYVFVSSVLILLALFSRFNFTFNDSKETNILN